MKTISDLAEALLAAHNGGPSVDIVPDELLPGDMESVYALQDQIINKAGAVGGWKVAAGLGDPPLCSPIPANRFVSSADPFDMDLHQIILVEIEVAVRLSADLPAGADMQQVEAAISSINAAIELIGDPFVDRASTPRNLQLGDLQSNGAVITGEPIDRAIAGTLSALPVNLLLDGQVAHHVDTGASWGDILAAIAWLSGHASERGLPLRAGQTIITGARALAPLNGAQRIEGTLGDWGRVARG